MCRFRPQATTGSLSADSVNDEAKCSLPLELGYWSAISSRGRIDHEHYVEDTVVESTLTRAAAVDLQELPQSFVFSQRLSSLFVLSDVLYDQSILKVGHRLRFRCKSMDCSIVL